MNHVFVDSGKKSLIYQSSIDFISQGNNQSSFITSVFKIFYNHLYLRIATVTKVIRIYLIKVMMFSFYKSNFNF